MIVKRALVFDQLARLLSIGCLAIEVERFLCLVCARRKSDSKVARASVENVDFLRCERNHAGFDNSQQCKLLLLCGWADHDSLQPLVWVSDVAGASCRYHFVATKVKGDIVLDKA